MADASLSLVELDGDGNLDLVVGGGSNNGVEVFRGDGSGNFNFIGRFLGSRQSPEMIATDINHDGNVDILAASLSAENTVWLLPGNGDGTFQAPQQYFVGQSPIALALVDWGSVVPDDSDIGYHFVQGVPDDLPDLVVANAGTTQGIAPIVGPPEIVVLPNLGFDSAGKFLGFGDPVQLSLAEQPLDVKVADFNDDGNSDIGVIDRSEFFVIYGKPPVLLPNNTQPKARDLGTVVHLVQPTLTITPQNPDDWYRLQVPTEVVGQAAEVLDFSGGFANQSGAGLAMEVVDANGTVLASGERLRVAAQQGKTLFVHVFGRKDSSGVAGAGGYTLAIDTLPQVAAVEAQSLLPGVGNLPGGPTTSLVLVFQGDRLDPALAENAQNYKVIWLGSDGRRGTADDREIPIGSGAHRVIYDASSNVDVASGLTFPTAVRQTVTLLFDNPLPAGAYEIEVMPSVMATLFSTDESSLLTPRAGFNGHNVVTNSGGAVTEGVDLVKTGLVKPGAVVGNLDVFQQGTKFLTQFHSDLGAILDSRLTSDGDAATISQDLLKQITDRFGPALGDVGKRLASLAIIFLDPVSIGLVDPEGRSFHYDLNTSTVASNLPQTFIEVGGNVEVIVIPNPSGTYQLNVADVAAHSRGGWVLLGNSNSQSHPLTDQLRSASAQTGQSSFALDFGSAVVTPQPVNGFVVSLVIAGASAIGLTSLSVASPAANPTSPPVMEISGSSLNLVTWNASLSDQSGGGAPSKPKPSHDDWGPLSDLLDDLNRSLRQNLEIGTPTAPPGKAGESPWQQLWQIMQRWLGQKPTSNHQGHTSTGASPPNASKSPPSQSSRAATIGKPADVQSTEGSTFQNTNAADASSNHPSHDPASSNSSRAGTYVKTATGHSVNASTP